MLAVKILDLKNFMNQLLCSEMFDHFLLQECVIQNYGTFQVEGTITKDFFSEEELDEQGLKGLAFLPYHMVRPLCLQMIKGKRTPAYFKFVFLLSPNNLLNTLSQTQSSFTANDITGAYLNLKFQNNQLLLTTGVSYQTFSMDKTFEQEWDALVLRFLKKYQITTEAL